jgi:enoyl-CoA hydratase/carnithine racemase
MTEPLPVLESLNVAIDRGVAFVTISHPPINLVDARLWHQLRRFARWFEGEPDLRVVVFRSADPDFFLAHADLNMIRDRGGAPPEPHEGLQPFHSLGERMRRMDKVSIAQIEGRARGGGSEFALGLDLRFAAIGKALLSQPEAALGLIPGGGATQRLPRLIGRARALEVMLSCEDLDAEQAERYGYINRALAPDHIDSFVRNLAFRIASHPPAVLAGIKQAVDFGIDLTAGLKAEEALFANLIGTPATREGLDAALQRGVQRREPEMGDFVKLCGARP